MKPRTRDEGVISFILNNNRVSHKMRHPAFTFAPNFINNQNKSSMAIKKVSNEFMAKVLNDVAW